MRRKEAGVEADAIAAARAANIVALKGSRRPVVETHADPIAGNALAVIAFARVRPRSPLLPATAPPAASRPLIAATADATPEPLTDDRAADAANDCTGTRALRAFANRRDPFHGTDPTAIDRPRVEHGPGTALPVG
jgi:hypothetical protein